MTETTTPEVLPVTRAWTAAEMTQFPRHDFDRADRPRTCQRCDYIEHDGSGYGWHPCSITFASTPITDALVRDKLEAALRGNLRPIVEWAGLFAGAEPTSREEAETFARFKTRRDQALDRILAALALPQAPSVDSERLREALKIAMRALCTYADPTGYTDGDGEPYPTDATVHPGAYAQAALDEINALSTSAESENSAPVECALSPFGCHQVDTSMESGPNNCFYCEQPMGGRDVR
jgi:hypothetical protein